MRRIVVSLCIICLISGPAFSSIDVRLSPSNIPLYETTRLTFTSTKPPSEPFFHRVEAEFTSPGDSTFKCYGFYNGSNTWEIRFMPAEEGQWVFTWQFGDNSGSGFFTCTERENANLHGHLYTDSGHSQKLQFEDGTPLYWMGGKYINFMRQHGTEDQQKLSFPERLNNDIYLSLVKEYIDDLVAYGLNGFLLKIQVLPLNYDLKTMDLDFFNYIDATLDYAMERGVNVQLNLFDIWGKRKLHVDMTQRTPDHVDWLVLEPWDPTTYEEATEFYLKYVISRYAAYPNIHWELFNEAERLDVSALAATEAYLPIIRKYDPYDLLVGSSEMYTGSYPGDMTFPHGSYKRTVEHWEYTHKRTLDNPNGYYNNRPLIWNEINPYPGSTLEEKQDWFRASIWGNFIAGSAGTSEECWLDIREVPDKVTEYHSYFSKFLRTLYQLNGLYPADYHIKTTTGTGWLCENDRKEYVAYIYTQEPQSRHTVKLWIRKGVYYTQFYDPKTGEWIGDRTIRDFGHEGWKSFETPTYNQDVVLHIIKESLASPVTPVELSHFSGHSTTESIALTWTTVSESNNYGFEIQRSDDQSNFETIGFVKGHLTTQSEHVYSFIDRPRASGVYTYRLKQIDLDGQSSLSKTIRVEWQQTGEDPLCRVYPNPSSGTITFDFLSPGTKRKTLEIYNALNQRIYWQLLEPLSGPQTFIWKGKNQQDQPVSSGIYFYRIKTRTENQTDYTGKFLIIR